MVVLVILHFKTTDLQPKHFKPFAWNFKAFCAVKFTKNLLKLGFNLWNQPVWPPLLHCGKTSGEFNLKVIFKALH